MKFEHSDLLIVVNQAEEAFTMKWQGSSDARNPSDFLEPVFKKTVSELKSRPLTIDFTELEFMNSSTVSPIISLLKDLDRKKINTRILFSDEDWQQVHMRCIRTITRVLTHIEVVG